MRSDLIESFSKTYVHYRLVLALVGLLTVLQQLLLILKIAHTDTAVFQTLPKVPLVTQDTTPPCLALKPILKS